MSDGTPGSHPHTDRPNWQPASTLDDYLRNVEAGLEAYSERRLAKLMGMTRIDLWRARHIAELPADLFEILIGLPEVPSARELANVGRALAGETVPVEAEYCPHCGVLLRRRRKWSPRVVEAVNAWLNRGGS